MSTDINTFETVNTRKKYIISTGYSSQSGTGSILPKKFYFS